MLRFIFFLFLGYTFAFPVENSSRIVGGQNAVKGQFPYMVSLRFIDGPDRTHFCGGSIISDKWILTAAHCFIDLTEDDVDLTTDTVLLSKPGKVYKVAKIIVHKDYNQKAKVNDIALVQTTSAIAFGANVAKISFDDVNNVGEEVTMSGWGYTIQKPTPETESPDNLQFLTVKTFDLSKCEKQLPPQFKISDKQICTTAPSGQGMCEGDSGGPLVKKGSDGSWKQVGIVSYGIPCARGIPDVYTRVTAYKDWIATNTK